MIAEPHPSGYATLLDAALDYERHSWCVIPVSGKKPRFAWKQFQRERPSPPLLHDWFSGRFDGITGLAVVLGDASQSLACRDFDDASAYHRWATDHPKLAAKLPTVQTARGFHVLFTGPERFVNLDDGEYRGDSKHISLLPPSVHPSGTIYRWTIQLPEDLPTLNPRRAGLLPHTPKQHPSNHRQTQAYSLHVSHGGLDGEEIAIAETLPDGPGQRNHRLFDLARRLKAIMPGASVDALEIIVRTWHTRALPMIRTKDWLETWIDFRTAWARVKRPAGATMAEIVAHAKAQTPVGADAIGQLLALCRAMQAYHGGRPWPLSCRMAAQEIGLSRATAARLLKLLCCERVLELVSPPGEKGSRIAAEYRVIDKEQGGANS